MGTSITKDRMSNLQIKLNYLHSLLSIIHKPIVLEATIRDMNLNIPISNDMYTTFVDLFYKKHINIDNLILSLVENNIACINKTLTFNDK